MGKLYIGNFGKIGDYFAPQTNYIDHGCTINFDGSRFHSTNDGLYMALHVTSMDGLNEKSTCAFPCSMLFKLSTKPYEYETFSGGAKKKETVEPSVREKLLLWYLNSDSEELNWAKNQGKGGMVTFGEYSNDASILAGEGNAKRHSRFVIEFDDDIKPFDMSGDGFSLDGITSGATKAKSNYSGKPAETESQKIEARAKTIEALVKARKNLADDISSETLRDTVYACMFEPAFAVHMCLLLGLAIPSNLTHWDI